MKTSTIKIKLFFLTLMTFAASFSQSESDITNANNFIFFNLILNDNPEFYNGKILLKNGSVLEGDIHINATKNDKFVTIIKVEDDEQLISNSDIKNVILENNNKKNIKNLTKFVSLNDDSKLYRQLYLEDSANGIFDTMTKPFDGKIMNDVYVLDKGNLTSTFNFWHSGAKSDLIHYFEDRDNKKYKRKNYRNLDKLFSLL